VLATSDALALGVLDAAADAGLRVPEDLSVAGFDDVPEAATATPPLTTVHQDHAEKGRLAGEMLVARLRGEGTPQPVLLPARLSARGSTAPPRNARA
jgi:DNA-binding LacI/PurR family transcriptional regulator